MPNSKQKSTNTTNAQRRDLKIKARVTPVTLQIKDGETMADFIQRGREVMLAHFENHLTIDVEYNNIRQMNEVRICHAAGIGATKDVQEAAQAKVDGKPKEMVATMRPIIYDPSTRVRGEAKTKAPKLKIAKSKPTTMKAPESKSHMEGHATPSTAEANAADANQIAEGTASAKAAEA